MKRKQRTKFTDEQINFIKTNIEKGISINSIAKELSLYPQVVQTFCKNNGLKSKNYSNWTENEDNQLIELYSSKNYSVNDIAKVLNKSVYAIQCRAKILKVNRPCILSNEEKLYIDNHYGDSTISSMARTLKRKNDTVRSYMIDKGYETLESKLERMLKNDQFKNDFHNPQLSHAYVARKYGFNDSYICSERKKRIGNYKQMTNTFLCKSTAEMDFEDILEELDLTYFYEYKIGKWKVDYYLGHKLIVEIQGEYWHKLDKVKEKDERKFSELREAGYTVIEIWENELKDKEFVFNKIKNAYKNAVLGQELLKS